MESYTAPDVESGQLADPGPLSASLNSVEFAYLARAVCAAAEEQGLSVPTFRSPPTAGGAGRSIRRSPGQRATVAVRYRSRPRISVAADMVEGVLQSGRSAGGKDRSGSGGGPGADFAVRDRLWMAATVALAELSQSTETTSSAPVGSQTRRAA